MNIRERQEALERQRLSSKACLSSESRGRPRVEPECPVRMAFQHDRDRIIHSKAFRRLKYKTQVLILPEGDHYRTRMTHTLEVMQIARTIARALGLNEDLTEAIALGHDLGHTPFGHVGEDVLNRIFPEGFKHSEQSLRVVDVLEKDGEGLNLTHEVRDGILHHSKGTGPIVPLEGRGIPQTMEGMVVRVSDIIAYLNHDLDDALRARIITMDDVPPIARERIGEKYSARVNNMVVDVIEETARRDEFCVYFSKSMLEAVEVLRKFLLERVYQAPEVKKEAFRCYNVLKSLFDYYMENDEAFERDCQGFRQGRDDKVTRVKDFIAGMTDRFALRKYVEVFVPRRWVTVD